MIPKTFVILRFIAHEWAINTKGIPEINIFNCDVN